MSEHDDIASPPTTGHADDPPPPAGRTTAPEQPRRGGGVAVLALAFALLALLLAGHASWREYLAGRSDDTSQAELRQRLDAIETRLTENERRAARSNELAGTLRTQLGESEALRERLRSDLVALADRAARAEAMLAELSRERGGARQQLAVADAALLLGQADARLRLFGDRPGAVAALDLAELALARAGVQHADLRHAVIDARAALDADSRPSDAAVLAEIDILLDGVDALPPMARAGSGEDPSLGWWARQFDRLDSLVSVRRIDELTTDTTPDRAGVRRALERARRAAIDHDSAALATALASARQALTACCERAAAAPLQARLERLLAIDWHRARPDLDALRQQLDGAAAIGATPEPDPEPSPLESFDPIDTRPGGDAPPDQEPSA
ncbi:MAG: uroporphyrinogen-III C-methyltransferase [Xanthomonadales bacterium]|nr:uroporphyrinogen-III C-methyltransferase [Xanthomonadales bacterium]